MKRSRKKGAEPLKITNELYDIIEETKKDKTKAYDTPAEVTRTEGSTLWVHIPGGVKETPIKKTVNASPGDTVQVRVSGGTAWVVGNASAPPTDDTTALKAEADAESAAAAAGSALRSATTAREAADEAETKADAAGAAAARAESAAATADSKAEAASTAAATAEGKAEAASAAASRAETAASAASTAASNASRSANAALTQLSTVESVLDTLNWISEHATYKASTDTEVVPGKYYFTRSGSSPNYTYTLVVNPTGNPSTSGYYEIDTIDEAVSNYIETHLALDGEGLWIIPDDANGSRVLVSTGSGSYSAGTFIIGGDGIKVAQFSQEKAVVGKDGGQRLEMSQNGIYGYNPDSANFFTVDYNGGQVTTNGSLAIGSGMQLYAVTDEELAFELFNATFGSNIPSGTQLTPGNPLYFNIYTLDIDFETSVQPTLTGCTLSDYEYREITVQVPLPTITVGTDASVTATAVITHTDNSTLTAGVVVTYTASTNAISVSVSAQGSVSTAREYWFRVNGGPYSWAITTNAPSLKFGTNHGTPGLFSVSLGEGLYATKNNQTAIGKYNVADTETQSSKQKALIIGNGTANNARSNALTVNWSGDVEAARDLIAGGDVTDGSGNVLADKADASSIPTKTSDLTNDSGFLSGTGLFKIVDLAVTNSSQIAAHGYQAAATYTVPAASRPSGMTLVGIVGYGTSNYRLQSTTHFVKGSDSIFANMANTSATAVSAGAKITFKLLYIKATSA